MTPDLTAEEQREVITTEIQSVMARLDKAYDQEKRERTRSSNNTAFRSTMEEIDRLETRWVDLELQLDSHKLLHG